MQIGNSNAGKLAGYTEKSGNSLPAHGDNRFTGAENAAITFAQAIQKHEADSTAMGGMPSSQEMTMEEYKQYIAQKIRQIPVHPGRRHEYLSVTISEEGYAAMKNDPEYEAWVLNDLRSTWSQPGFFFRSGDRVYTSVYYGATKEECHTDTWTVPDRSARARERARERREENRRRLEKKIKRQKLQKHLREIAFQRQRRQRALVKKLIEHRQEIEEENRRRWKKTAVRDKADGSRVLETTTRQKTVEKITERDIIRVEEVLRKTQLQQEVLSQRFFEDGNFYGFQFWMMNG